jgi:hypothetical protein
VIWLTRVILPLPSEQGGRRNDHTNHRDPTFEALPFLRLARRMPPFMVPRTARANFAASADRLAVPNLRSR